MTDVKTILGVPVAQVKSVSNIPITGVKTILGSNVKPPAYYGVEWNVTNASPTVTRIASDMTLHATLPVHSLIRGCLLLDDGTVNYYLKADDWTKKADGSASNLDGTDGQVMVVQDHNRTIYTPEQTPALFSFYREVKEGQEWIPNEDVELNETRTFEGKIYKCIQAHKTLEGWTPSATPALWQDVVVVIDIPVWKQPTGAHDAYKIGEIVHYPDINGQLWRSKINANTTKPDGDVPYNRYWEPYK